MDLLEQQLLTKSQAKDFTVSHLLGTGQHGMVIAGTCKRLGLPNPKKLYAVKLLFNFTHEYTSVLSNQYENEWLVLSRLLPHPNIIRYWSQFISSIPDEFLEYMPIEIQKLVDKVNSHGECVRRKGQFLVLDYYPRIMEDYVMKSADTPLQVDTLLRFSIQITEGVQYLEQQHICHLDLKLANILLTEDFQLVLCDFGCAVQFPDASFILQWHHGINVGGNRAHLSPEVLSQFHKCRRDSKTYRTLCYKGQPAFALGVIIYELATRGDHPLGDYPLGHTTDGIVQYMSSDMSPLRSCYPQQLADLIKQLLDPNPATRLDISSALRTLGKLRRELGCQEQSENGSSEDITREFTRVCEEKDLAQARLVVLASERDFALKEMKSMADQCQVIASEFELLAKQCESMSVQLKEAQKEKDTAVQASESAFEAYEMLHKELELVVRERDMARTQIDELKKLCIKAQVDEGIRECMRCQQFYLLQENTDDVCQWHPGKYLVSLK